MAHVPDLRSPYLKVGRLVFFGRMIDKIRLQLANALPADYQPNYGDANPGVFDARCCRFLGVSHSEVVAAVRTGKSDAELLAWCHERGGARTDEQCEIWNAFMSKRGWRDEASPRLQARVRECGFENHGIETYFDLIEVDEGREPGGPSH